MNSQFFIIFLIHLTYLCGLDANYQYLGVQNVNQMEPPSLESTGIIFQEIPNFDPNSLIQQPKQIIYKQPKQIIYKQPKQIFYEQPKQIIYKQPEQIIYRPKMRSLNKVENQNENSMLAETSGVIAEAPSKDGWKVVSKGGKPKSRSLNSPIDDIQTKVMSEAARIRMVGRHKEESPLKIIQQVSMDEVEDDEQEKELKPNMREKIETYTETYVVSTVKTRVRTRKRLFMQKRKIVNKKINRPMLIIRRKLVKEKQIFERIIPKIIEIREIVNHPFVKSQVIEGPVVEVTEDPNTAPRPGLRSMSDTDGKC